MFVFTCENRHMRAPLGVAALLHVRLTATAQWQAYPAPSMHLECLAALVPLFVGIQHPQVLECDVVAYRGCTQAHLGPDEC